MLIKAGVQIIDEQSYFLYTKENSFIRLYIKENLRRKRMKK